MKYRQTSRTKKYNLLVPYNDMPEEAKVIIRAEYDKIALANLIFGEQKP